MGSETVSGFLNKMRIGLGGVDSGTLSDSVLLSILNSAYISDVSSVYPLAELESVATISCTSGTAEYEIPDDYVLKIISVVDVTNGRDITDYEIDRQYYEFLGQGNPPAGDITHWFVSGVGDNYRPQITFFPTPNKNTDVKVYYRARPASLTNFPDGSGTTILPAQWDDTILSFAIGRGWAFLGELTKAQYWKSEGEASAKRAFMSSGRSNTQPRDFGSNIYLSLQMER